MLVTKKYSSLKLLILLTVILSSSIIIAQASNTISSVQFSEIKDKQPVKVKVLLINALSVARLQIVYKSFQETDFRVKEMEVIGNLGVIEIPAEDVSAPIFSYYLIIEMKNGTRETYPLGVPEVARPIDLTVVSPSKKDQEILILSPLQGETLSLNDLFISVSLVRISDKIETAKTKIILNGIDVTKNVLFSGDLLLYYPQNFDDELTSGKQNLEVEVYGRDGKLYHKIKRSFTALDDFQLTRQGSGISVNGSVIGEIRSEQFNEQNTLYNNLALTLSAKKGDWRLKGYGYITSEENKTVQPQNRYSVSLSSNWINLRGGDSYPHYNNLLLNGKRVRGIDGRIDLGYFHLQGSFGETRRAIEGSLLETYGDDDAPLVSNVVRIDSTKYGAPFGRVDFGVYSRSLLSGRIGVGSQNGFEFGISFLHSKDNVNSVEFGAKPQENIVASSDVRLALDNNNIILKGVAAISMLNSDITSGTYSDEQIDSIFSVSDELDELGDNAEDFKDFKNKISPFFTVNQFIEPVNFTELSSLAAEGSLELNYFRNNLKASYIYRGNQFKSFGQEYTRTDIAGVNIVDRIRMLDNQLFFTLGYEDLYDNLQGAKIATTSFKTLRASVSLFIRGNIPNFTLGYIRNENKNDIIPTDSINMYLSVNDITDRYSLNIGYDFTAGVKHNTSVSFSSSDRIDNGFYNNDAKYFSAAFSLNSYWTRALISNFSAIYYNSEIANLLYKYVTISAGGRYKLLNDNMELALNYSPSFGDFNRHAIDFIVSYQLIQNLWMRGQIRYYSMDSQQANTISGVTLRYNF